MLDLIATGGGRGQRGGALLLAALVVLVFGGSAAGGAGAAARDRFAVPPRTSGRLDSRLAQMSRAAARVGAKVRVVVRARQSGSAAAAAVGAAGGTAILRAGRLVEALVPPARLAGLAHTPAVAQVRAPDLVVPQSVDEGVPFSGADAWHNAGIDGSGAKVAIVDVGFAGYQALEGTALPASVTPDDRCDGNLATPVAGGGSDHGTAVAELVHQMAPGAQLYLICVDSEVGLALAEQDAAAYGVKIINSSLAFFGPDVGRGDGSGGPGSPDAVVARARADGILWVNAAGNYDENHWSGHFTPDSSDPQLNDFWYGNPYDQVQIASGEQACVVLTWDDWPVTTEDYDLYLFRDGDGSLVGSSTNDQSGGLSAPEEDLCYTNTDATTETFDIVVANYDAVGSPRLDLYYLGSSALGYSGGGGSVPDPASSPDALTVGAACWRNPNVQQDLEYYSSFGPTVDARTKPDLVAADHVSTATYGDATAGCMSGFSGTSAAAPQVAGAAALVLQKQPGLDPASLTAAIEARALAALGGTTEDQKFGNGLLTMGPPASFGAIAWTDGDDLSDIFDGTGTVFSTYGAVDPNWSADGTRLNVEWLNSNLGSIAADGTDGRAIAGSPSSAADPVWSPDGTTVAYGGVSVYDITTGTTTALQPGTNPEWSPDGSQIAYISSGDVWRMNANGDAPQQVTHLGDVQTAARALGWSPDGSQIAFEEGGGIWLVNTDGSDPHQIVANGFAPVWSPDGTQIAFVGSNGTPPDTYALDVVDANGTHETTLYRYGWEYAPRWFSWTPVTQLRGLAPPSLSGTAQVGQALATSTGRWQSASALTFSYQWHRCDPSGANCSAIPGATQESYTATEADLGAKLLVEVDATDGTTSLSSRSAASGLVGAAPPSPTAMPSITGTAEAGKTLSIASPGTWSTSVTLSYQWRNCDEYGSNCLDIPGATSASYSPTSNDVGATIRLEVTAAGAGGTSRLSSPQSAVVSAPAPTLAAGPSVSGLAAVGHTLTTTSGTWESVVPLTGYSFQWERCNSAGAACAAIAGATASSYALTAPDAGYTLRAAVEATNSWAWSAPAESAASNLVLGLPDAQALPVVSGTPAVGKSLSASTGSWSWSPTGYAYQWERCKAAAGCVPISGATGATYPVVAADAGNELEVVVSATNAAGTGTATSAETAAAVARPAAKLTPEIGGVSKVGRRLTAMKGLWTGPPARYRYQWLRCNGKGGGCRAIAHATRASYRLAAADVRHRIRVRVAAMNAAGIGVATSRPTARVKRR